MNLAFHGFSATKFSDGEYDVSDLPVSDLFSPKSLIFVPVTMFPGDLKLVKSIFCGMFIIPTEEYKILMFGAFPVRSAPEFWDMGFTR
jgi:hypothetical protein